MNSPTVLEIILRFELFHSPLQTKAFLLGREPEKEHIYVWLYTNQAPGKTPPLTHSCAHLLSCVRLFATPWAVACQSLLSMEFSRPEYWSG